MNSRTKTMTTEEAGRLAASWGWRRFDAEIRSRETGLLARLDEFESPVLIAGCQRSGTTMLGKVLASTPGLGHFEFAKWPELSAALVLSGEIPMMGGGRSVFQVTYLDECYRELESVGDDVRIVWILRNPHSVITSLLYNWPRFALNDTFNRCALQVVEGQRPLRRVILGTRAFRPIEKACAIYLAKVEQLKRLSMAIDARKFKVLEYDQLVTNPQALLREVSKFIDHPHDDAVGAAIHQKSSGKAERLTARERSTIDAWCGAVWEEVRHRISAV